MHRSTSSSNVRRATLCALALACSLLGGCAVISVASAAVGVVATGAGLAVDAAVGAVKLTGRAIGIGGDSADAGK
ncbi:MAG: hypothetical protein JWQ07_4128 [Ramlibacter sp.]|nr:hypothetical protein [Ramlibacter sp.]